MDEPRQVTVEVIGPGGDVVDTVDLTLNAAVRLPHSTVRLVELAAPELDQAQLDQLDQVLDADPAAAVDWSGSGVT
jgi:hypothetical protein